MQSKQIQTPFQVKEFDAETGIFEGYANTFDYKDHAGDITQKGAFTKSLMRHKENGTMPALLWQHEMKSPIGVWLDMKEDAKGLWAKGKLTKGVQKADEALLLMKDGALKGLSIGYFPEDEEYSKENKANLLKQVDLLETSLVTFPCNDQSQVESVKTMIRNGDMPTEREFEKALRDLGFSQKLAKQIIAVGYKETAANDPIYELEQAEKLDEILNLLKK